MSTPLLSTDPPVVRHRRTIPAGLAFAGAAITFTSLYLAAGALTPLLVVYKDQWGFPASLLTLAFAAYAIGFLAALLTLGSLSDRIGRRPVLIGALIVQLASNVMFLVAPDVGWVIAARIVQGIAGGAATAAFTAALVELAPPNRKRLGAILGSVGVTGGLALGSLLAGLAIQLSPQANAIVFVILTVVDDPRDRRRRPVARDRDPRARRPPIADPPRLRPGCRAPGVRRSGARPRRCLDARRPLGRARPEHGAQRVPPGQRPAQRRDGLRRASHLGRHRSGVRPTRPPAHDDRRHLRVRRRARSASSAACWPEVWPP